MKLNIIKVCSWLASVCIAGASISSCQPDEFGDGNGNGLGEVPTAAFTVTPIPGEINKYVIKAETAGVLGIKWDFGDGSGYFLGNAMDTVFYPDAGKYKLALTAIGRGGLTSITSTDVNVLTSDPNSGNIVRGGKLDTPDDIDQWTVLNISASGTSWSFNGGKATVTGGGWNQQGFYQEITVIEGQKYKIDLVGSSTTGVSNAWFEVYCSTTEPTQNSDYSAGGILRNINTWDGCGTSAFSGKISSIGCNKDKNIGTFTATASGIMYLVIKCGGENLNGGISVDNIELRGTK